MPAATGVISSQQQSHTQRRGLFAPIVALLGVLAAIAGIVAGTGYSMEQWHQTVPTIDMGKIDPTKPFSAPLEIKNPSPIFDMHSPGVSCRFSAVYSEGIVLPQGGTTGWHGIPNGIIPAGQSAVFFCDMPDKFTFKNNDTGKINILVSATMVVAVRYETWIPVTILRETPPTTFTFLDTSTGYQWVKGALIK